MEIVKENNLIVTKKSVGLPNKVVPLSLEFQVVTGNSLFNTIMDLSSFNNFIESSINPDNQRLEFEGYTEQYKQKLRDQHEKLRVAIINGKPKITIKIELETYE